MLVVGVEDFASAIEAMSAKKGLTEECEKGSVFFIRSNGIEERDAAFRVSFAEFGFGEEKSAGAIVG